MSDGFVVDAVVVRRFRRGVSAWCWGVFGMGAVIEIVISRCECDSYLSEAFWQMSGNEMKSGTLICLSWLCLIDDPL